MHIEGKHNKIVFFLWEREYHNTTYFSQATTLSYETKLKPRVFSLQNVNITNFSSSWNDGMAFCKLIHHFHPEAFDFGKLDPKKRRANFSLAFHVAEWVHPHGVID